MVELLSTQQAPIMDQEGTEPGGLNRHLPLAALMLASTISFVDRQVLSLLVLPIQRDLKISDTQISLLLGAAFVVCYALAGIPIGRLVDTRRRWTIVAVGMAVWSAMTAATCTATSYRQLFLFRMGVGVGEASLNPSAYSLLADIYPKRSLGLALAVFSVGIYLGAGVALIIGGQLIGVLQDAGQIDLPIVGVLQPWQAVFLIVGTFGIPFAIGTAFLREPARKSRGAAGEAVEPSLREVWAFAKARLSVLATVILAWSCVFMASYSVSAWQPTFMIRSHDWTMRMAGVSFGTAVALGGIIGSLAGGWLSDRLSAGSSTGRLQLFILATLSSLPFAIAFPLVADATVSVLLVGVQMMCLAAATATIPAVLQEVVPPRMRGILSATALLVVSLLGLGSGPTIVALITDQVWGDQSMLRYSLVLAVPLMTVSAALAAAIALRPYRAALQQDNFREERQ